MQLQSSMPVTIDVPVTYFYYLAKNEVVHYWDEPASMYTGQVPMQYTGNLTAFLAFKHKCICMPVPMELAAVMGIDWTAMILNIDVPQDLEAAVRLISNRGHEVPAKKGEI